MQCVSMRKRGLCCLLTAALLFTMILPTARVHGAETSFSDVKGHWAESYITQAVSKGFVGGYPDGTFQPNKAITRAEFSHMLNAALGNKASESVSFSDVPKDEWFYTDVCKAVSAAYVSGYDDKTFRPNNPLTRQEAAVILARIVPTAGQNGNLSTFPDYQTVSDWAVNSFARINAKGYIGTYSDEKLHPLDSLTRAQTAKIICDLISKETIVSADTEISDDNTRHTGKIFTNNVTVSASLGNGSATLDQCMVLGALNVNGGGENTVTISNSRIVNAAVSRTANPVRVLVTGESNILNLSASNRATLQTSALTGGTFGPGIAAANVQKGATILFSGSFPSIRLADTSEITVTSGTVDQLTIASGASGSDVTVESTGTVKDAVVNAQTAFHGSGTIKNMTVNASGVTYAKKPESLINGSGSDDETTNSSSNITIDPKNGATGVSVSKEITLTFDDRMTLYDGDSISSSDIEDFVKLRRGSSSGTLVDFSASISSSKKVITIEPDSDLDGDTKYFVIIAKNKLKNSDDEGNAAFSSSFTTEENGDISIDPKNGATGVSVKTDITLTFKNAMTLYNGNTLTSSKAEDVIELRKDSATGKLVSFSASVKNSKKEIVISPDSNLSDDTRYYVIIDKNSLKDSHGDGNDTFESRFNTGDEDDDVATYSPKNGSSNIAVNSSITITFPEKVEAYDGSSSLSSSYLRKTVELRKNGSSSSLSCDISINSAKKVITIDPDSNLAEGTRYNVYINSKRLRTVSGEKAIPSSSFYFTTKTSTPQVSNLTLTRSDNSVAANVTGNQSGTIYLLLLVDDKNLKAPATADQVVAGKNGNNQTYSQVGGKFSGALSVSANSAKSYTFSGLTSGTNYRVYAVLRSGSVNSAIVSGDTTTKIGSSALSKITVSADTLKEDQVYTGTNLTTDLKLELPTNTEKVTVRAEGVGDISFDEDSTSSNGSSVKVYDLTTYPVDAKISILNSGQTETAYTLAMSVKSDTGVSLVVTDNNDLALEKTGDYSYKIPADASQVKVQITTSDKAGKITVGSKESVWTMPPVTLDASTNIFQFSVLSHGVTKNYTLNFSR